MVGPALSRLEPRLGSREASGNEGRWVGGERGGPEADVGVGVELEAGAAVGGARGAGRAAEPGAEPDAEAAAEAGAGRGEPEGEPGGDGEGEKGLRVSCGDAEGVLILALAG